MISLVALATVLAVLFYFRTAFGVGLGRRASGIQAPAMNGHETLERAVRVHMNTLEWMPIFLPLLWLATLFPALGTATPIVTAALGLVWIIGRWLYMRGYMIDPPQALHRLHDPVAGLHRAAALRRRRRGHADGRRRLIGKSIVAQRKSWGAAASPALEPGRGGAILRNKGFQGLP